MAGIQEYKCPCCEGAIKFDSSTGKVKCPYCDNEFEMETLLDYDAQLSADGQDNMNWDMGNTAQWQPGEQEGMRVYACDACGGQIVADANTAAKSCPYCDNPIVVVGSVQGDLKPDTILPFKLDKEAAIAKLKEHMQGKKLLPKSFKADNHLQEIKGLYVPYWVFDSKAKARMRYVATKEKKWDDSTYDYVETSYYSVHRQGDITFESVPVNGASKLQDDMMESLEPFDYSQAVPFQTAYYLGYLADRYDVDKDKAVNRANTRIKNSTEQAFYQSVKGYKKVERKAGNVQLTDGKASYSMFPVWILTTKWNGKLYTFAMNGQTGKFVGDLPADKSIAKKIFLKTAGITAVIAFAVQSLIFFLL